MVYRGCASVRFALPDAVAVAIFERLITLLILPVRLLRPYLLPVLLFLPLLLSACDSADVAAPSEDALIGTWTEAATFSRVFGTLNTTQEVINYTAPGTSTLRVEGTTSGVLRYPYEAGTPSLLGLLSSPQIDLDPTLPSFRLLFEPTVTTHGGEVTVTTSSGTINYYFDSYDGETAFTLDLPTVTFHDALFRHLDDSLRVDGTLTLATRTVEAGNEDLLAEWAREQRGSLRHYILDPESVAYRVTEDAHFGIDTTGVGTWAREDEDTLHLTFETSSGEVDTSTYTYRFEDGALLLTTLSTACTTSMECLAGYEARFHVAPNTLTAVRVEATSHLEPHTEAASR